MFIAKEKKENNVAEYVIYMWQIEDLIRAYDLDLASMELGIIDGYEESQRDEVREWYGQLIEEMRIQGLEDRGHLKVTLDILDELTELSKTLLESEIELKYASLYEAAKPDIVDLMQRSDGSLETELETCFTGLYGLLLLKLKGQKIATETMEGVNRMSAMVGYLAAKYKERS